MSDAKPLRAPFQVVVFPFRRGAYTVEYAIFKRSDNGWWQGLAGGGDERESPLDAARREAYEEGRVPLSATYFKLHCISSVPVNFIAESARTHWTANTLVIPNYAFAVDRTGIEFTLSEEHVASYWAPFDVADGCLKLDNNRAALWELDQRIQRSLLERA
jgi:dATP pyrophosphohydrolase